MDQQSRESQSRGQQSRVRRSAVQGVNHPGRSTVQGVSSLGDMVQQSRESQSRGQQSGGGLQVMILGVGLSFKVDQAPTPCSPTWWYRNGKPWSVFPLNVFWFLVATSMSRRTPPLIRLWHCHTMLHDHTEKYRSLWPLWKWRRFFLWHNYLYHVHRWSTWFIVANNNNSDVNNNIILQTG